MDGPDQVEEGGAVTFRCGTESVPEPIYTWEFNRTQTGGTTDSLTVEQVTFTHSGNYTCTARNTITGREASAFRILEVKGETFPSSESVCVQVSSAPVNECVPERRCSCLRRQTTHRK